MKYRAWGHWRHRVIRAEGRGQRSTDANVHVASIELVVGIFFQEALTAFAVAHSVDAFISVIRVGVV